MTDYYIVNTLLQRIEAVEHETLGNLYGIRDNGQMIIVGVTLDTERTVYVSSRLTNLFPTGIELCGLISIGGPYPDKLLRNRLQNVSQPYRPILLRKKRTYDIIELFYLNNTKLIKSTFSIMGYEEFTKKYFYIRIIGMIPVVLPIYSSLQSLPDMSNVATQAATELIFQIEKSDIFLTKNSKLNRLALCIGVLHEMLEKRITANHLDILHINIYYDMCETVKETNMTAPVIVDFSESSKKTMLVHNFVKYDRDKGIYSLHAEIPIDVLCITGRDKALDHIYKLVVDAVTSRILHFEIALCQNLYEPVQLPKIKTYHFTSDLLAHTCTLIFHEDDEEFLGKLRKILHKQFNLNDEHNIFYKENAIAFTSLHTERDVLTNVHAESKDIIRSPDSGSGSPDSAASFHTVADSSELNRVNEHLIQLSQDIDNIRLGLEREDRLHSLQMKALQSLNQKFTALQIVQTEHPTEIRELSATVERLNPQVQHLQNSIQELMLRLGPSNPPRCTVTSNPPGCTASTQTEISAVQYPADDLLFSINRPSSLPLTTHHVSQYEEHLFGDALRGTAPTEPEEEDVDE